MKALLQQALDALERTPTAFGNVAYTASVQSSIEALRAAIAQGESEPVGYLLRGSWDFVPGKEPPDDVCDAVYISPQAADYVPMTTDEIKQAFDEFISFPDKANTQFVTTTSTLLFAEHIAAMAVERAVRGVK